MAPPLVRVYPSEIINVFKVRLTPLLTLKICELVFPLITMLWPVASIIVFAEMVSGLVRVMVPSQSKVTVPPPDKAELKAASVGVDTTPPPRLTNGSMIAKPQIAKVHRCLWTKRLPQEFNVGDCIKRLNVYWMVSPLVGLSMMTVRIPAPGLFGSAASQRGILLVSRMVLKKAVGEPLKSSMLKTKFV